MTQQSGAFTVQQAYRLFRPPVVRVLLNWDRLILEGGSVSVEVAESSAQLEQLFTTWYLNGY